MECNKCEVEMKEQSDVASGSADLVWTSTTYTCPKCGASVTGSSAEKVVSY